MDDIDSTDDRLTRARGNSVASQIATTAALRKASGQGESQSRRWIFTPSDATC